MVGFKVAEDGLEVANGAMQMSVFTSDILVYGDYVPRCHHQIIEVGKRGLHNVVEDINLDLLWNAVEGSALDVIRDAL